MKWSAFRDGASGYPPMRGSSNFWEFLDGCSAGGEEYRAGDGDNPHDNVNYLFHSRHPPFIRECNRLPLFDLS